MPVIKEVEATTVLKQFLPKYHFLQPLKAATVSKALVYQLRYILMLDCLIIGSVLILYSMIKDMMNLHVPYELPILILLVTIIVGYSLVVAYLKMANQALYFDDDYLII